MKSDYAVVLIIFVLGPVFLISEFIYRLIKRPWTIERHEYVTLCCAGAFLAMFISTIIKRKTKPGK